MEVSNTPKPTEGPFRCFRASPPFAPPVALLGAVAAAGGALQPLRGLGPEMLWAGVSKKTWPSAALLSTHPTKEGCPMFFSHGHWASEQTSLPLWRGFKCQKHRVLFSETPICFQREAREDGYLCKIKRVPIYPPVLFGGKNDPERP